MRGACTAFPSPSKLTNIHSKTHKDTKNNTRKQVLNYPPLFLPLAYPDRRKNINKQADVYKKKKIPTGAKLT